MPPPTAALAAAAALTQLHNGPATLHPTFLGRPTPYAATAACGSPPDAADAALPATAGSQATLALPPQSKQRKARHHHDCVRSSSCSSC